jgi:acid-sensing ion channel, other
LRFPEGSHSKQLKKNYPLTATRQDSGLKLSLFQNLTYYNEDICDFPSFLIHSPFELPGSYENSDRYKFDFGFDLQVLITPEIITTDDDLRSIEPRQRGCYFEGERKLEFFKVYTKMNCEFECFSSIMRSYRELNCTQYFAVRDEDMEMCDYRDEVYCQGKSYNGMRDKRDKCDCLDECNSIKYTTEVIAHKIENKHEASFEFKFKDVDIVPLKRYQLFTFSEFLAQAGGMMGLFAGISVLSIVEIFYFLSLRWMTNCCKKPMEE